MFKLFQLSALWFLPATPHHNAILLAVPPQRFHQVLLAAEAEVLDGLGDTAQRAVDLLGVQVLAVVLQHAAARDKSNGHFRQDVGNIVRGSSLKGRVHCKIRFTCFSSGL